MARNGDASLNSADPDSEFNYSVQDSSDFGIRNRDHFIFNHPELDDLPTLLTGTDKVLY